MNSEARLTLDAPTTFGGATLQLNASTLQARASRRPAREHSEHQVANSKLELDVYRNAKRVRPRRAHTVHALPRHAV